MIKDVSNNGVPANDLVVGDIFKLKVPTDETDAFFMKIDPNPDNIEVRRQMGCDSPSNPMAVFNLTTNTLGMVNKFVKVRKYRVVSDMQVKEDNE